LLRPPEELVQESSPSALTTVRFRNIAHRYAHPKNWCKKKSG